MGWRGQAGETSRARAREWHCFAALLSMGCCSMHRATTLNMLSIAFGLHQDQKAFTASPVCTPHFGCTRRGTCPSGQKCACALAIRLPPAPEYPSIPLSLPLTRRRASAAASLAEVGGAGMLPPAPPSDRRRASAAGNGTTEAATSPGANSRRTEPWRRGGGESPMDLMGV